MRLRLPRSVGIAIALSVAAGAAIGAAVIASAGSAQESPGTLHLVGTAQNRIGFGPDRKPRQGDRFGGGSKIAGDDTGISRSVCTMIGKRALCAVQLQLSRGKLSAQGLVPQRADDTPLAITGGTGAYKGARGTARTTQISRRKTRLAITLRP